MMLSARAIGDRGPLLDQWRIINCMENWAVRFVLVELAEWRRGVKSPCSVAVVESLNLTSVLLDFFLWKYLFWSPFPLFTCIGDNEKKDVVFDAYFDRKAIIERSKSCVTFSATLFPSGCRKRFSFISLLVPFEMLPPKSSMTHGHRGRWWL